MRTRRMLGLALLLGLGLRAGFGLTRAGLDASADERNWDGAARVFWKAGLLHSDGGTYRPPLYPLMVAGIYQVCGPHPEVVRLWQALLGTATVALLYGIGRRLGGERVGLLAAGLGAVYPLFVFFAAVLMAETLLVLLTTAALLLALRLEAMPSAKNAAALGLVLGLGALCKPVVLAWVPFLLWGWWCRPGSSRWERSGRAATAVGMMALVLVPWTLRNAVVHGFFVPISSNLGMNLMIGNEPGANGSYRYGTDYLGMFEHLSAAAEHPVARDRLAAQKARQWIAAEPGRFGRLAIRKFLRFWSPLVPEESLGRNLISLLSCGPVLALGLWGTFRRWGQPGAWIVGSLLLSLTLVHAVFFAHTRFRLPIDAALIGPAAWILERGWSRWRPGCAI